MRPPGPVPGTSPMVTPSSRAYRRTVGDAAAAAPAETGALASARAAAARPVEISTTREPGSAALGALGASGAAGALGSADAADGLGSSGVAGALRSSEAGA